jgi:hypothetical protein
LRDSGQLRNNGPGGPDIDVDKQGLSTASTSAHPCRPASNQHLGTDSQILQQKRLFRPEITTRLEMAATLSEFLNSQDELVREAALALPHQFSQCTYSLGPLRCHLAYHSMRTPTLTILTQTSGLPLPYLSRGSWIVLCLFCGMSHRP